MVEELLEGDQEEEVVEVEEEEETLKYLNSRFPKQLMSAPLGHYRIHSMVIEPRRTDSWKRSKLTYVLTRRSQDSHPPYTK